MAQTVFQDISECLASGVKKAAEFASTHNNYISSCFTQFFPIYRSAISSFYTM